jgi:hypothetical protein
LPDTFGCNRGGILLDLRLHLVRGMELNVQGARMTTDHISEADVRRWIVPGINEAWAQANISFRLERVVEEEARRGSSYERDLRTIENSGRSNDSGRLAALRRRISTPSRNDGLFHVFVVPFMGNTYQGVAFPGSGYSIIGAWTNKHNGGRRPEPMPIAGFPRPGSLARTAGHELGHLLSLQHNQSSVCRQNGCLMKGSRGSLLTGDEIEQARRRAERFSRCP